MLSIVSLFLFVVSGFALVVSTIVGLPGGWILLFSAIALEAFDISLGLGPTTFGWWFIALAGGIQIGSEVVEFAAGALGAKYGGASKRGMWGSVFGGIAGAILGTFLIPIPLFGSLLGSVIGSFGAAYAVEIRELDNKNAIKSATGAALGRTIGALGKVGLTLSMLIVLTASMTINLFF